MVSSYQGVNSTVRWVANEVIMARVRIAICNGERATRLASLPRERGVVWLATPPADAGGSPMQVALAIRRARSHTTTFSCTLPI